MDRNREALTIGILVALWTLAALAGAQESDPDPAAKAARKASLADPTQTQVAQDGEPALTLASTEEGTRAIGRFGWSRGPLIFNLQLETPFQKGQEEIDLVDLDGLAGDTVGKLSLTYEWETPLYQKLAPSEYPMIVACGALNQEVVGEAEKLRPQWHYIPSDQCTVETLGKRGDVWQGRAARATFEAERELCREYNESLDKKTAAGPKDGESRGSEESSADKAALPGSDCRDCARPGKLLLVREDALGNGNIPPGFDGICSREELRSRITKGFPSVDWTSKWNEALSKQLKKICDDYNAPPHPQVLDERVGECSYVDLAKRGPKWELKALRAIPFQPWYLTFKGEYSKPTYEFVDTDSLEDQKVSKANTGLTVELATLRKGLRYSLGYTRREVYNPGKKTDLCRPSGDSGALTCNEVRLGAPTKKMQDIARVDLKWLIRPRLGADLRLLYDFKDDLWNPHFLLYFLEKKDVGLNGGLDLGYDKEKELTARVFIGTKFNLTQ